MTSLFAILNLIMVGGMKDLGIKRDWVHVLFLVIHAVSFDFGFLIEMTIF